MTKREAKRQAMLRAGQLLFNSDWPEMFDACGLPEEHRTIFIQEVQDIGWRLQEQAKRRIAAASMHEGGGKTP